MPVKSIIIDPATGLSAEVDATTGEKHGVVVATRPLKDFKVRTTPFINGDYGADMTQDAAFGGTPEYIHNGTDTGYWTGSTISGTGADFASTAQSHGGTKSVLVGTAGVVIQFAKGSDLAIGSKPAITLWLYLDTYIGGSTLPIYGWDVGVGQLGIQVDILDYANTGILDTWQKVIIPIIDMNLTNVTIDAVRIAKTLGAIIYLDDIQIEETGGNVKFTVEALPATWYHVTSMSFTIADNVTSIVADGTLPGLSYDKFLGVTATNGLLYQRLSIHESIILTFNGIGDMLNLPGTSIKSMMSDGTNTFLTLEFVFAFPLILKPEDSDSLSITLLDDYSDLLQMNMWATGFEEPRVRIHTCIE